MVKIETWDQMIRLTEIKVVFLYHNSKSAARPGGLADEVAIVVLKFRWVSGQSRSFERFWHSVEPVLSSMSPYLKTANKLNSSHPVDD